VAIADGHFKGYLPSVQGQKHSGSTSLSDITQDSYRFEQSFSDDGGTTWEPHFVATLTREKE
jgi:hypothetical protein